MAVALIVTSLPSSARHFREQECGSTLAQHSSCKPCDAPPPVTQPVGKHFNSYSERTTASPNWSSAAALFGCQSLVSLFSNGQADALSTGQGDPRLVALQERKRSQLTSRNWDRDNRVLSPKGKSSRSLCPCWATYTCLWHWPSRSLLRKVLKVYGPTSATFTHIHEECTSAKTEPPSPSNLYRDGRTAEALGAEGTLSWRDCPHHMMI